MAQIDQRQMLPMGTVLDHRYRIVRYLASGGFGNTYVAEDTRLGGQVAVKEFFMRGTNHRSADGTTVEVSNDNNTPIFQTQLKKFQREAKRIFELQNDHIIQVIDLFDANGTSYFVMKLINGTSLANQILSEQDALDVIFQVLNALEAMHKEGLYHLDVKPGNIMCDQSGHCTLIDFGASKQMTADERSTLSSSTMSYTPGYAPVEQVTQQTKSIGPWTDFYALGATLYRLVTGAPPPEVEVGDTAPNGRKFPYPPYVSLSLRHIISTLMNPDPRLRPQNATLVRELLKGEDDSTIHDKPTPEVNIKKKTYYPSSSGHSPYPPPPTKFPIKWLWIILTGLAVIVLGILLFRGCNNKDSTDSDLEEELDSIADIIKDDSKKDKDEEQKKDTPPPPTSYKECPDNNHPHKIDLGLPSGTLWACCNVDATKPEDYGGYYAWGETTPKSEYNWNTYKHCDGIEEAYHNLGTSICGTQYDVAYVEWGDSWQMPTVGQTMELFNTGICKRTWTTLNGVKGQKFTGPNGGSIFLPTAGGRWGSHLSKVGDEGYYWSGTQNASGGYLAYSFRLSLHSHYEQQDKRCFGFSVRAVAR